MQNIYFLKFQIIIKYFNIHINITIKTYLECCFYLEFKCVKSSTHLKNKSSAIQNQLSNTKQPKSLVLFETPILTSSSTLPGKLYSLSSVVRSFQKTAFLKPTTTAITINHYPIPFISYLNSKFGDKIKCKNAITIELI